MTSGIIIMILAAFIAGALLATIIAIYRTTSSMRANAAAELAAFTEKSEEQYKALTQSHEETIEKMNAVILAMQKQIDESQKRMNIALIEKEELAEKNRALTIKFMEFGDPDSDALPNVSYKLNDVEISKRMQEALRPWQARVDELESQLDLANIENKDSAQLKERELTNKVIKLGEVIAQKEEENVELTLKINKAIMAYEALNKRYKSLL